MKIKAGMEKKLRIILLEDLPRDVEIIRELLIDAGYDLTMDCTAKGETFVSLLCSRSYDIILADFKLPGFDGFTALQRKNEIVPHLPFICVSGTIGEETAVELLKQGAVDYVMKDRLARLPMAIQRALDEAKEKEKRRLAELQKAAAFEALRESEQRFSAIFRANPAAIAITGWLTLTGHGKRLPAIPERRLWSIRRLN